MVKGPQRQIAYFSMEIGLHPDIPTYAGGLGILAGDTVRAAADLKVPMVGVTLLHRKGYFFQRLDPSGWQTEEPVHWVVKDFLKETGTRVTVDIEGRKVEVRAWQYDVRDGRFVVPVFLLDTDLESNSEWDRTLTHYLYGGDQHYRLCQEVVLGIAGVRIPRALGYDALDRFHMNEGHAALLTIELLREQRETAGRSALEPADLEAGRSHCVFTTHTPVSAAHDRFPLDLVERVLGNREACGLHDPVCHEGRLNLTYLALTMSRYVNGVAKKHGETSRHMFAEYTIDSITNGVPSLSVLDGWWIEGCIEGVTGWAIDDDGTSSFRSQSATSLYDKLAEVIIPMFYGTRKQFIEVMRHAIALNGSFFNTQRMVQQYAQKAYL